METIAMYWEPEIKTYGFHRRTPLALIHARIAARQIGLAAQSLEHCGREGDGFLMTVVSQTQDSALAVDLVVETAEADRVRAALNVAGGIEDLTVDREVGLIYFHGPHFGDRYGIADAALGGLTGAGIAVRLLGCSAASVYLIVAQADLDRALACLTQTFTIPCEGSANGNNR